MLGQFEDDEFLCGFINEFGCFDDCRVCCRKVARCLPLKRGDRQGCGSSGMMCAPAGVTEGNGGVAGS